MSELLPRPSLHFAKMTCVAVPKLFERPANTQHRTPREPAVGAVYYAAKQFAHSEYLQLWLTTDGHPFQVLVGTERRQTLHLATGEWLARLPDFVVHERFIDACFEAALVIGGSE